jgi:predicted phosphoribosyltransferase
VAVELDPGTVLAGAVANLAVLTPLVALYAIAGGVTIAGAVAGALIGPLVGGIVVGRRPIKTPLTHGAAAAAIASLAYVIFRIIDGVVRSRPVHPASVAFLFVVGVTFGSMGGWLGFRARAAVGDA